MTGIFVKCTHTGEKKHCTLFLEVLTVNELQGLPTEVQNETQAFVLTFARTTQFTIALRHQK